MYLAAYLTKTLPPLKHSSRGSVKCLLSISFINLPACSFIQTGASSAPCSARRDADASSKAKGKHAHNSTYCNPWAKKSVPQQHQATALRDVLRWMKLPNCILWLWECRSTWRKKPHRRNYPIPSARPVPPPPSATPRDVRLAKSKVMVPGVEMQRGGDRTDRCPG